MHATINIYFLFFLNSAFLTIEAWIPQQQPQQRSHTSSLAADTVDARYYSLFETPLQTQIQTLPPITLNRFLQAKVQEQPELRDLESLYLAVQMACKTISTLVHRAGLVTPTASKDSYSDGRYYSMKRLDLLSTLVLKNALKYTGKCQVVEPAVRLDSESPATHQPGVLIAKSLQQEKRSFVAVLDPLDGSGNADASICTGTVFGVFEQAPSESDEEEALIQAVLQPAKQMRAAGYCLYSSATVMVVAIGDSVQGFTLDPQTKEFVLTHPDLTIPTRGNVYSCNEGNSEGWDPAFRQYIQTIKTGRGQTGQRYAHRYVGSMVGDIHRTLLYGGIFCYPRDNQDHPNGNLQLLYKSAPMAYVVEKAGGRALGDADQSLLEITPERVHQKYPCFMGSADDVAELQEYLRWES
jgi:fructose-1,6-bisphosphatase I